MNDAMSKRNTCLDKPVKLAEKPIYLQVAYQLELDIKLSLKPGDLLDSEMNLAERFGVNRHTVRRSIEQLVQAGIVVKQQGRGTQVVSNQIEYLLNPSGKFTKNLNELGKTAHAIIVDKRILDFKNVPIKVQRYFDEKTHDQGYLAEVVTLRFMENVPVCLIHHYLSLAHLPDIHTSYLGGSLHQHISERFSYALERQQINISATLADGTESMHLKCAVKSPLVKLQSINRIRGSREVVEVSVSHSRPDRLQYQIDFKGE